MSGAALHHHQKSTPAFSRNACHQIDAEQPCRHDEVLKDFEQGKNCIACFFSSEIKGVLA